MLMTMVITLLNWIGYWFVGIGCHLSNRNVLFCDWRYEVVDSRHHVPTEFLNPYQWDQGHLQRGTPRQPSKLRNWHRFLFSWAHAFAHTHTFDDARHAHTQFKTSCHSSFRHQELLGHRSLQDRHRSKQTWSYQNKKHRIQRGVHLPSFQSTAAPSQTTQHPSP